ncbi:glycosyltransferase family 39 protein [Microvirga sp. STR05]|uniref:Glycosyltransferase family 39 protein n=1 Tax=Hymenobacter duratus TaxID=2771356 RepID=A0ABR8JB13_9BACT|nr:glycosyltransferase family 39 protein [Hymenobacter duratus]MBD2713633.1 glycosyltransferase family 39 protein [Hymenobacter duratus]MBR7948535.1 glycosyltransferase family 39 protein [Microvirga sp. STR05]
MSPVRNWVRVPANQLLLLLLALAAVPLCYELGRNPIQLWDESRLAVNAAEMSQNGNLLVTHFEQKPDHWNTKPPLMIWLQALSFTLFGFSAWALRLPTALASLATVVLLFRFAARDLRLPAAGFLGGLILATSIGYVRLHVARTADYDVLLTLWEVVIWTSLFRYLETGRSRALLWLAVGLTAAVLTKSIAALLGMPGLLLYTVVRGKFLWVLRQRRFYLAAGAFLLVVSSYFWARELADPGYWKAMSYNDLGGRYLTDQLDHAHPWDYYLTNIQNGLFQPWLWLLLPSLLLALLQPDRTVRWAAGLLVCFVGSWLTVLSTATSKLEWYDAPIYPALALLVGLGLALMLRAITTTYLAHTSWLGRSLAGLLALLLLFYAPYETIVNRIVGERHSDYGIGPDGYLGGYLKTVVRQQPQLDSLVVLYGGGYNATLTFYQLALREQQKQMAIYPQGGIRNLVPGMVTLLCNPDYRARIDSTFEVVELHQDQPCQTLLLLSRKPL